VVVFAFLSALMLGIYSTTGLSWQSNRPRGCALVVCGAHASLLRQSQCVC